MDRKQQGRKNNDWGHQAEAIVADWLMTRGYVIRERNWKVSNKVEIDLIAEIPGTVIFIEVKARKGDHVAAHETIDRAKMKKIARGADMYIRNKELMLAYRLDVITVTGTPDNFTIEHLPDAFMPDLG